MRFRGSLVVLTAALLVHAPACALVAGLNDDYAAPSSTDGATTADATMPDDGGFDVSMDAIVLAEASVDSSVPEACVRQTCADLDFTCGSAIPDGCGGLLASCGDCPDSSTCGGGGGPNKCGASACVPAPCNSAQCGVVPDGCGGTHACATNCSPPAQCKAGGCGGCTKDGTLCAYGSLRWPAWLCDDTGTNRGGSCNRAGEGHQEGLAYYCCAPF